MKPIDTLKERLIGVSNLEHAQALLSWDQEVHMPSKGSDARATASSHLSSLVHVKFLEIDSDGLLTNLKEELDKGRLADDDAVIIAETWRVYDREKKLPEPFVREMAYVRSKAQTEWQKAVEHNDFKIFEPWLIKIVNLKRQEAKLVGFEDSPYDALLDTYEPGMTAKEAYTILTDVKEFLVPFLQRIQSSKLYKKTKGVEKKILGKYELQKQKKFNIFIAQKMGFDIDAGKLETSAHPFTISLNPSDVRFTTRYNEKNVMEAIGATIHETGHALYEQGLPSEHFGTPVCESVSLGIHESQSRMWENSIGKSAEFWKYFYPKLQKEFPVPFKKVPVEQFYFIINQVKPSLIRIEADEVTYNLHIILRFEIEKALIEGSVEVKDLPKLWNEKMKEYFGIVVPKDSVGVLQDVHWSIGLFGYFPTYSFGNLYAAQFYDAMKKQMPDINKKITKGDLMPIREWLRTHIHSVGKRYTARELVLRVTGEPLSSDYFKKYIENKFSKLYSLD